MAWISVSEGHDDSDAVPIDACKENRVPAKNDPKLTTSKIIRLTAPPPLLLPLLLPRLLLRSRTIVIEYNPGRDYRRRNDSNVTHMSEKGDFVPQGSTDVQA